MFALVTAACGAEDGIGFDAESLPLSPLAGAPGSLVVVETACEGARLVWQPTDGSPGERIAYGPMSESCFFTVPADAEPGVHKLELVRDDVSVTRDFEVTAEPALPPSRLDRVVLHDVRLGAPRGVVAPDACSPPASGGDGVDAWLWVQGANVGVGSAVVARPTGGATWARLPTVAWAAVHDVSTVEPEDSGFAVGHHLALLAPLGPCAPGTSLQVAIERLDGTYTDARTVALPATDAEVDSDLDGIADAVEVGAAVPSLAGGTCVPHDTFSETLRGVCGVNAPLSRYRPDFGVEVDILDGVPFCPDSDTFDRVRRVYEDAPFLNPDGTRGINLVLRCDTETRPVPGECPEDAELASVQAVRDVCNTSSGSAPCMRDLAADAGTPGSARDVSGPVFLRYLAIGPRPCATGGTYHTGWAKGHWVYVSPETNNALVSRCCAAASDLAAVIVHELGHTMGLCHDGPEGGSAGLDSMPTYNSTMGYAWLWRDVDRPFQRQLRKVCAPMYYGVPGAREIAGERVGPGRIDYSSGTGRSLDETDLDEADGVCGEGPVDWNLDGDTSDVDLSSDVDGSGTRCAPTDGCANDDPCDWCGLRLAPAGVDCP